MYEYDYEPETTEPTRNHCRHIHSSGQRCGSPSLRNEHFCYYHHTTRRPISKSEAQSRASNRSTFTLLEPEDRTAIQLNLGEIIRRIAANDLDPKRAGLLLYALQIAASNLPKHNPNAIQPQQIEEVILDEVHGPIAPECEFQERGPRGGKTLEQILREQWAKDEALEAAEKAEEAARNAAEEAAENDPGLNLQATASTPHPLTTYHYHLPLSSSTSRPLLPRPHGRSGTSAPLLSITPSPAHRLLPVP